MHFRSVGEKATALCRRDRAALPARRVALEKTADDVKRARQLADETRDLQISCLRDINCN